MRTPDKNLDDQTGREESILGQWARQYRLPLLRFFRRRAPDSTGEEDLVQEVFARLANKADLEDVEHIEGYIFKTANHVLSDYYRRVQRKLSSLQEFDETVHGLAELTPERVSIDQESLDLLARGLHALPERTRTIFVLYHFENMLQKDIAQALKIPISTLEKHMARANRYLLDVLDRS